MWTYVHTYKHMHMHKNIWLYVSDGTIKRSRKKRQLFRSLDRIGKKLVMIIGRIIIYETQKMNITSKDDQI